MKYTDDAEKNVVSPVYNVGSAAVCPSAVTKVLSLFLLHTHTHEFACSVKHAPVADVVRYDIALSVHVVAETIQCIRKSSNIFEALSLLKTNY
jgi:hypothetical protein